MQTPEEIAREFSNNPDMQRSIAAAIAKERWLPAGMTPQALLSICGTGEQLDTLRRWADEIEARRKGGKSA